MEPLHCCRFLRVHFDGGYRDSIAACGFVISGSFEMPEQEKSWIDLLRVSLQIDPRYASTSIHAELFGCQAAVIALISVIATGNVELAGNSIKFHEIQGIDSFKQFDGHIGTWLDAISLAGTGVMNT